MAGYLEINTNENNRMELFNESEIASKSPRLKYMEKHDIKTNKRTDLGPDCPAWEAWSGDYEESVARMLDGEVCDLDLSPSIAIGLTEEEAIDNLARNRGIEFAPN